ncbi:MAG TPA: proton-conducting transporter membrane subunit [Bryobacteraceae bacterium]|nr:proton-conducting transporter membrane subunit [Bryobacteraceae bacterium]
MPVPGSILTVLAIGIPWLAGVLILRADRHARLIGFSAALVSVVASGLLLWTTPARESLSEALMLLFSSLTLGATLVIPQRDCKARTISGILFLLGATLLAYSTQDLMVLLVAWILSTLPFFPKRWFQSRTWRPRLGLVLSSAALTFAIGFIAVNGQTTSIARLRGQAPGGMIAFWLLVAAVIFRKGICPAHAWVADAADGGPAIPTALLLNGHFGALLVAKLIGPLFPDSARDMFPVLSYLALATALYVAIRALTETSPRRLVAFLALSQSACILAGLESRTAEGITGALVHWMVVTVSTMGLLSILRLLEVRFGENLSASAHLGLAEQAPRLAVFFVVFGLALVGLPGTLSFCSQDLLIHGTLRSHPQTGLLLPVAIAMNAVSVFRLFVRLFLGKRRTGFTVMADALPRERWTLTVGVLFVVLGGLFPSAIVSLRSAEAETISQTAHAGIHFSRARCTNPAARPTTVTVNGLQSSPRHRPSSRRLMMNAGNGKRI